MSGTVRRNKRKHYGITICLLIIFMIVGVLFLLARIVPRAISRAKLPVFFTYSLELTETAKDFSISDYYITNKVTGLNRYYIDEELNLWGYGTNEHGQLGNGGISELGVFTDTPYKIASDVVSVDCSINGYFCIYLTADGELYGMGSNMLGLLGQDYDETNYYAMNSRDSKVTYPVLLMEGVAYARAGRESIVALKKDGSVWWWGQYMSTYGTNVSDSRDSEKTIEDESNPRKMLKTSPCKMLENCVYVTTGDWTGAALSENGDLYTWGLNIFGQCGTKVTGDDYIRTPCKVLENVRMVWSEKIEGNSILQEIPEQMSYGTDYLFNTFVQLKDGTILAAGRGIGEERKNIALTGDLKVKTTYIYSDTFVPVRIKIYSDEEIQKLIGRLEIGTNREEVEKYLSANGIQYLYTSNYDEDTTQYTFNPVELRDLDQKYIFYFDAENKLTEVSLL